MSYCRWSCDNWKSDVYCYEGEGGFVTHVASSRVISPIPQVPPLTAKAVDDEATMTEWLAQHNAQLDALETAERAPINGPHDGASFYDDTLPEFLARLLWLRQLGYHVPQHAINAVQAEMTECPT